MAYIPKNRIQTNLYTAGGEYYIEGVTKDYVGYYHKLYNGKVHSGKNPNDAPIYVLTPIRDYNEESIGLYNKVYVSNTLESYTYGKLAGVDLKISKDTPQLFFTKPTEQDYELGEFQRYFCKKRNESIFLEISKITYNRLNQQDSTIDFQPWMPFSIPWELVGEKNKVTSINQNIILLKEDKDKLYGFSKYLKEDYLKYYKP